MHALEKRIFRREMQRPSSAKLWQIPGAMLLPNPFAAVFRPWLVRVEPLEAQETSYLAEPARRLSFSSVSIPFLYHTFVKQSRV
jgi:hypothetical protein